MYQTCTSDSGAWPVSLQLRGAWEYIYVAQGESGNNGVVVETLVMRKDLIWEK